MYVKVCVFLGMQPMKAGRGYLLSSSVIITYSQAAFPSIWGLIIPKVGGQQASRDPPISTYLGAGATSTSEDAWLMWVLGFNLVPMIVEQVLLILEPFL